MKKERNFKMIKFGQSKVPELMTMSEVVRLLTTQERVDYSLLMPLLLFLQSVSSSQELISLLMLEYMNSITGNVFDK